MIDSAQENGGGRSLNSFRSMEIPQRRFRLKQPITNEVKLYEKYFNKGIARQTSYTQFAFVFIILGLQLINMGLLYGPGEVTDIKTKTAGIWPSIFTSFASGITLWAVRKPTYFKLHLSMALHIIACLAHVNLVFVLIENVIPSFQLRIYETSVGRNGITPSYKLFYQIDGSTTKDSEINESEWSRLTVCLIFSVCMSLAAIIQAFMSLFMSLKTGRAICIGRTQMEGRVLQVEAINPGMFERNTGSIREIQSESRKDYGTNVTTSTPKLERSDALPPPPYESGYFNSSICP